MKRILITLLCIVSLIAFAACGQQAVKGTASSISGTAQIQRIKVTANQANVKTSCSNTAPTTQTLSKNSTADVISKVLDWYAVKLPNNTIGFIPESQAKPIIVEEAKPTPTPTQATGAPSPTTQGSQTNANSASLTAEEQQMVTLVNEARAQNNVAPLSVDMELTNCARLKSQDMINNNYFSHNSPTYGSPFDMMKSFGISYVKAGENIAGNQAVAAAHNSLMNSPGHRKNILDPDYTHIGLGIKKGGPYGMMFTQQFISKPR